MHEQALHRWKAQVDRQGLEMLRPRERPATSAPLLLVSAGRAEEYDFSYKYDRAAGSGLSG